MAQPTLTPGDRYQFPVTLYGCTHLVCGTITENGTEAHWSIEADGNRQAVSGRTVINHWFINHAIPINASESVERLGPRK
ncbi:MAG: hypothetical protein F6K30_06365 [Cyanothece sp. SIO2G6]|nr:hypothetical protein [Cyanothece sp. SIO2G6]